jgi:DNA-binding response OmpR family regulator
VVVVEDDPDASDILAELLKDRGCDVTQCPTGEEGLSAVRRGRPDAVFLDLMLPDIDGYKVCEAVKLDRETNYVPVIMVTALSGAENRVKGFRVGADFYVTKPYTAARIHEVFDESMRHVDDLKSGRVETWVKFDISSEIQSLKSVNELFGVILSRTRLSEKQVSQLRTALLEIGTNAIEWGNRHDVSKLVYITSKVTSDRIELTITDEGEGFDPHVIPHACNDDDDPTQHFAVREMMGLREGGFGILMARGLMDEVSYNDRGNSVRLVKKLN